MVTTNKDIICNWIKDIARDVSSQNTAAIKLTELYDKFKSKEVSKQITLASFRRVILNTLDNGLDDYITRLNDNPSGVVWLRIHNKTYTRKSNEEELNHSRFLSSYPMLSSLGINLNLTKYQEDIPKEKSIQNLISEIVNLYKTQGQEIKFEYKGNSKPGVLVPIPKSQTYDSFFKQTRTTNWLDDILCHMASPKKKGFDVNNDEFERKKEIIAEWIISYLSLNYEESFIKVCERLGYRLCKKMDVISTAAMWVDANVSMRQARIVLKHLHKALGFWVASSDVVLDKLSLPVFRIAPPKFGRFEYYSKNKSNDCQYNIEVMGKKKPEIVEYWVSDPTKLLAATIQECINESTYKDDFGNVYTKFGYPSVDIIIGSDHGAGASHILLKANLLSSKEQREKKSIEYGSEIFQFSSISCKKDTSEILSILNENMNDYIETFQTSKLIGIQNVRRSLSCCVLVPKYVGEKYNVSIVNKRLYLNWKEYDKWNRQVEMAHDITSIYDEESDMTRYEIWTVVNDFKLFVCGDLAFFTTISGRENYSSCGCPYCDLTRYNWGQDGVCIKPSDSNEMTLYRLKTIARNVIANMTADSSKTNNTTQTHGVKCLPLWNIDPSRFIVPILHIEIGLVNKVWVSFKDYLSDNVDMITEDEQKARIEADTIEREIIALNDRYNLLVDNLSDIIYKMKELRGWIKANNSDRTRDKQIQIKLVTNKQKLVDLNAKKRSVKSDIKDVKTSMKIQNRKKTDIKGVIKAHMTKRVGNEDGLDTKLEKLLEETCKIYPQTFHGGEMNGVCCRRLLDNIDILIENIHRIVLETFKKIDEGKKRTTQKDVKNHIDDMANMLRMLDYIFSLLRTPAPKQDEIQDLESALEIYEIMWKEQGYSLTPKHHVLMTVALKQVRENDGIADMAEDHVEKAHQTGIRLDQLTARLKNSSFKSKQMTQIKRMWLAKNKKVCQCISKVVNDSKRKFRNLEDHNKKTKYMLRKHVRCQRLRKIKEENITKREM